MKQSTLGRFKSYKREEKVKLAMQIFWERGYHNVTLNELVSKLGMGKRSFYNEFDNKEELYRLALKTYVQMRSDTESKLVNKAKTLDNIIARFNAYLDKTTFDPSVRSCMMGNTALELGNISQEYRDLVSNSINHGIKGSASELAEVQKNGEIDIHLNLEPLATLMKLVSFGSNVASRGGIEMHRIKESVKLFFNLISNKEQRNI